MDTYNNRPMSYESSKILLQYLEANTRFQLSNRIPSIRKMEKLVPMKLHTLKFSPFEFMINDTRYKLGTCRDYPTGVEVLYGHQNDNLKGGVSWDLDQYGFRDFSDGDVVTPGDVVIKDPFMAERNPPDYEFLESTLRVFKWVSAKRSGQEMDPLDEHIQEGFLVYQNPEITNEFLQKTISELEATLAPFRCRRGRTQRPFTTSIQLTVVSPGGEFQIWRKPSVHPVQNTNFKLYEAQKQLADRLFGNRADNVCVKNFEITSDHLHPLMIVRLPPSFQIKIVSLTIHENAPTICDAIQDLVHDSSYPLRKLEYKGRNRLTVHPTIAGARELHFVFYVFAGIQELLLFQNHNIYMGKNTFTLDEHMTLLRNWIDNRREIGASFISLFKEEDLILEIFAQAKQHLNGFDDGARCVRIPLNDLSQIKVSYMQVRGRENWVTLRRLIIEVVAV